MKKMLVLVVSGMAALPVSTGLAAAQGLTNLPSKSMVGIQDQNPSNTAPQQVYAPSDIAVSPSGVPDDHRLHGRQARPFSWLGKTSPGSTATALNLPHLCFEPGVGWTTVSDPTKDNRPDANQPGEDPGLPIHRGISPAGKSREAAECPPMPLGQASADARGTNSDDSSGFDVLNPALHPDSGIEPYGSSQNPLVDYSMSGQENSQQTNPGLQLPAGLRHDENHNSADPIAALADLKALRRRAYISPVKLRQLSRNMADMETRLELRQMNTEVEKRHKSTRRGEDRGTPGATDSLTGHKQPDHRDLLTRIHDCQHKPGASKSRLCSLVKSGGIQ